MALAQRAGLHGLAARHVRIGRKCGVNGHLKVPCVVAGLIGGRTVSMTWACCGMGAMSSLFGGVRAPSTLGSFLRSFTWGMCSSGGR